MIVTKEEALAYLGIDYADAMVLRNIERVMATAEGCLHGSVGEDLEQYLPADPRAKELVLIYIDDLYSERGVGAKVSGATRRLVADMELQLRIELRAAKDKGGASA